MATQPITYLTSQEYLALERQAEYKSEYFDGEMVAMVGASREHNLIAVNVAGELRNQLKGKPCEVYSNDMRVKIPTARVYTYPDVVVACGKPQFEDEELDTLLTPTLIVEVLSASTESYDRGKKFALYRRIPTLAEYVLVEQDEYHVEHYGRQANGGWLLTEASSLDAAVHLPSIGCVLQLREVYDKVELA